MKPDDLVMCPYHLLKEIQKGMMAYHLLKEIQKGMRAYQWKPTATSVLILWNTIPFILRFIITNPMHQSQVY